MLTTPAPRKDYRHNVDGYTFDCTHRYYTDGRLLAVEVKRTEPAQCTPVMRNALVAYLNLEPARLFVLSGVLPV
jgi:hypothetical protein